jgi:hypothetical protein
MHGIADAVGRAACGLIWRFVPLCQTGESVAPIGYVTMALIILVAAMAVGSRRT